MEELRELRELRELTEVECDFRAEMSGFKGRRAMYTTALAKAEYYYNFIKRTKSIEAAKHTDFFASLQRNGHDFITIDITDDSLWVVIRRLMSRKLKSQIKANREQIAFWDEQIHKLKEEYNNATVL